MLDTGKIPRQDNVYIPDCFIWNQRILDQDIWDLKRISYYTSVVGDDERVKNVRREIAEVTYETDADHTGNEKLFGSGQIVPFVRKKSSRSRKESVCDIAIAVDVMRACYRDHAENIWIFSGDGDFVNLVEEAVHSGKRVYLSALSSGLAEELRYVVDEFISLDDALFLTDDELAAAEAATKATSTAKSATKNKVRQKKS